jgi:hypothetical protein
MDAILAPPELRSEPTCAWAEANGITMSRRLAQNARSLAVSVGVGATFIGDTCSSAPNGACTKSILYQSTFRKAINIEGYVTEPARVLEEGAVVLTVQ